MVSMLEINVIVVVYLLITYVLECTTIEFIVP